MEITHTGLRPSVPETGRNQEELKRLLHEHVHHHPRLGQILLNKKLVTSEALQLALQVQSVSPRKRLGDILVETNATTKSAIHEALIEERELPSVCLEAFDFDPGVIGLVSAEMARQLRVIPLMFFDETLILASHVLPDTEAIRLLRFTVGHPVSFVQSSPEDFECGMLLAYQSLDEATELADLDAFIAESVDEQRMLKDAELLAQKAPLVQLVNSIIKDAVDQHASDIHIRPGEKQFDLLYRIDDTLIDIKSFKNELLPAVVSRIKILSSLNIAEHRLPQDGRIRMQVGTHAIDLRISIIPVQYGESVMIRVLNKSEQLRSLDAIGFTQADRDRFFGVIKRSHGIVLVTGPTGSGKTTTLYAALQERRGENLNVITVEDPIEYELANTRQIQVLQHINFGFAQALRHILRHDPDIIMIGEMRDFETSKMAMESALTGHLVFSTLHTNDAPGALERLMEIGVAPYMIRSAVIGVLAQRLVRCNCEHCLNEENVSTSMRENLGLEPQEKFYRGTGCKHCHHTGFKGRMAIYELLVMNDELREHVQVGMSMETLRAVAKKSGMVTLEANGVVQARNKRVSIAELYRACM